MRFDTKAAARQYAWDRLEADGVACFPFPPHGRIPNFDGAKACAERLLDHPLLAEARRIKVNPDAPQRYVRIAALRRGLTVFVPTPRLRGGFKRLDPTRLPDDQHAKAASLSNMDSWAEPVDLPDLSPLDAIMTGSVAVTRDGRRCGKGEGYSDLEFAILRELGHAPVPVATTVHPLQLVDGFPTDDHDVPLRLVITPDATISVDDAAPPPAGISWDLLDEADLAAMPILRSLRRHA